MKKKKKVMHIPQSVADSIPYDTVFHNGIIMNEEGIYSKSYRIPEINFRKISDEEQLRIGTQWAEFLGIFDSDVTIQTTSYNKTVDIMDFQENVMIPMRGDKLDEFRVEYNNMLLEKMTGAKNNLNTEKYLTISCAAPNFEKAVERFAQIDHDVTEHFTLFAKNDAPAMSTVERLDVLNSIYNQDSSVPLYQKRNILGHEVESFTLEHCIEQGITTKDIIAPTSFNPTKNQIDMGSMIAKAYYISNYPTWLRATILTDLYSIPANMLVTANFNLIPQEEAIKLIRRQRTNISSSLVEIQKKSARSGIDPSLISPELQDAKSEAKELMNDMSKDNARMFIANVVVVLFAASQEELKAHEKQLYSMANKSLATIKSLVGQQEYGFNSALPLANNQISVQRLMTTNTVASMIPFDVREVRQKTGLYYGLNASSRNMILYDRTSDMNPCACILGMPGSGKSFSAKREIENILLNTDDEVYVIDPEGIDYTPMAEAFYGSVIRLETGSKVYLNPFDLNIENAEDDGDPVKVKTDFIETICEVAIGGRYGLDPKAKSIIDRCSQDIYNDYMEYLKQTNKIMDYEKAPTMLTFYNKLMCQPQPEAQSIALSLERFVKGALDIFSHHTNVEIDNRFTVFNIKGLGQGLKEMGLQICLDHIWNKMIQNYMKGKRTWFYVDEFHLMMQKPTSSAYLAQIFKRARKWRACPTIITQNVEDVLKNEDARTIINNCSFITLLQQSPMNKMQLSAMLNISVEEQKYISSGKSGMGLLRIQEDIVPFDDKFPKNTKLYQIMTTKPNEVIGR